MFFGTINSWTLVINYNTLLFLIQASSIKQEYYNNFPPHHHICKAERTLGSCAYFICQLQREYPLISFHNWLQNKWNKNQYISTTQ